MLGEVDNLLIEMLVYRIYRFKGSSWTVNSLLRSFYDQGRFLSIVQISDSQYIWKISAAAQNLIQLLDYSTYHPVRDVTLTRVRTCVHQ